MKCTLIAISSALMLAVASIGFADSPLIVHEWGTITTHHLPDGTQLGGLNRIKESEVLPTFVHKYEPPQATSNPQPLTKSPAVPGRPDVTMRLETPVIYFYNQNSSNLIKQFDVGVRFRGGVLNEFYPKGEATVALDNDRISSKLQAGVIPNRWDGSVLNNFVVGSLAWKGIRLGDETNVPETDMRIWLAPRKVQAKFATTQSGEGEKYLFYRGVANLDALVRTKLSSTSVDIMPPLHLHWLNQPAMTISKLWLVEIRENSEVAFHEKTNFEISKVENSNASQQLSFFSEKEFSAENLTKLRVSMKQELTASGLFDDEAEAMIETWKESYYATPGLRIFYIVPKEWIDYFLPLNVSVPYEAKRVLIGRIDLQR